MNRFNKYFHPMNFRFAHACDRRVLTVGDRAWALSVSEAPGIQHVEIRSPHPQTEDHRCEKWAFPGENGTGADDRSSLEISAAAGMQLRSPQGEVLLEASDGAWFAVSGDSWLFQFHRRSGMQFYGLGEKHVSFERSGRSYQFWNTDVWADHPLPQVEAGDYDPDYISIPYLIVKQGNTYLGLLVDNPGRTLVSISPEARLADQLRIELDYPPMLVLGAESGPISLYLLYGPSLPELTRRFQQLVGTTPLPPLWALGYHQCRWGYRGQADLMHLAERFTAHRFPADGLWLDIDYMDGFRVFTFDRTHLPRPSDTTAELRARGYRVVPILDPGVKREPGYPIHRHGLAGLYGVSGFQPAAGPALVGPPGQGACGRRVRRFLAGHERTLHRPGGRTGHVVSARAGSPRGIPQSIRPADGAVHPPGAAGGRARAAAVSALPGRSHRFPEVRGSLDRRQLLLLCTPASCRRQKPEPGSVGHRLQRSGRGRLRG